MIELSNIRKFYQMGPDTIHALDDVSLRIDEGDFVSIIGPSGSGKSTLMNLIGCLDTPSSGTYVLDGMPVEKLSRNQLAEVRNRSIGFVFQTFNLLPRLSALENVEVPLVYAGVDRRHRRALAQQMLEKVGLSDRGRHLPNELSGGQRQRVAIARALAGRPAVLLADEPTGALDTRTGEEIMALFAELHKEGTTIVLVTHDPVLAEKAPRIIRLKDGRIVGVEDFTLGHQVSGSTARVAAVSLSAATAQKELVS